MTLMLCDVRADDYVICQSFTFPASVNPVIFQRATPVLVDSEPATWNIDRSLLEEVIKGCISI